MFNQYTLANNVRATLNTAITATSSAIILNAATGDNVNPPTPSGYNGLGILTLVDLAVNPTKTEIITYVNVIVSGGTVTLTGVVRGVEGTTPNAYAAGAIAFQAVTAGQINSQYILLPYGTSSTTAFFDSSFAEQARIDANGLRATNILMGCGMSVGSYINSFSIGTLTNNYSISSDIGIAQLSLSASSTITGFLPANSLQSFLLVNTSAFTLTLAHQNSGSVSTNRMSLPNSSNLALAPNASVRLWYSSISSTWFVAS